MSQERKYNILYFGLLADRRGVPEETLESMAHTVEDLYAELDRKYGLGIDTRYFRAAVNDEFVYWDHPLLTGDTVAFMPPMSGG